MHRPLIRLGANRRPALIDHRLDGEHHAFLQLHPGAGVAVMQNLRIFMHLTPDAVPAIFLHHYCHTISVLSKMKCATDRPTDFAFTQLNRHS
ncbi:hypothetical protein XJ27_12950 [Xanthomonas hortorum]|nr:hypothetical protein XJ27_12950 [Xanthomonas hortorum]